MITQILFQLTSAAASIGRVNTSNYTVSRQFNAIALGAVAADFTEKFLRTGRPDDLVGLTLFAVLTGRTLLILALQQDRGEHLSAPNCVRGSVLSLHRHRDCRAAVPWPRDRADDPAATGGHRPRLPR